MWTDSPIARCVWDGRLILVDGNGLRASAIVTAHGALHDVDRSSRLADRAKTSASRRSRELWYDPVLRRAIVLVFSFAFVREGKVIETPLPAFSGSPSHFRERWPLAGPSNASARQDASRIAPGAGRAIPRCIRQLIGVLGLLVPSMALLLPLGLHLQHSAGARAALAILAAGTVGFAAVGTVFAAMPCAPSRATLLPVSVSGDAAGARGRHARHRRDFRRTESRAGQTWLSMLVFLDVVFITLALDVRASHERVRRCASDRLIPSPRRGGADVRRRPSSSTPPGTRPRWDSCSGSSTSTSRRR
jgi:hypothetical protein